MNKFIIQPTRDQRLLFNLFSGIIFLIIFTFLFSSCRTPKQQLDRLLRHHPELINYTTKDTFISPPIQADTHFIFKHSIQQDTIVVTKQKIQVKYFYNHKTDTIYLKAKYLGDTLIKEINKIVYKPEGKSGRYYWLWIVIGLVVMVGLWIWKRGVVR